MELQRSSNQAEAESYGTKWSSNQAEAESYGTKWSSNQAEAEGSESNEERLSESND